MAQCASFLIKQFSLPKRVTCTTNFEILNEKISQHQDRDILGHWLQISYQISDPALIWVQNNKLFFKLINSAHCRSKIGIVESKTKLDPKSEALFAISNPNYHHFELRPIPLPLKFQNRKYEWTSSGDSSLLEKKLNFATWKSPSVL